MEVKPGYKQTDVGSIPDDWACLNLATEIVEMTDFVAAGSFESLRNNVHVFDNPKFALYVRLFDLRLGLGHKAQKYVDEKSYKFLSKSNLFGNEILIANIGANVGEAFLMPTRMGAATIAPNMIVVRTNDRKLRFDFLHYYITSDFGQERISELIAGSGQPKINKTDLKKYRVLVPPLSEQSTIAAVLSDVDALLNSLDRLIAKKHDLKQAAMQQLLTGQTRLPGFSGEWGVKRLGDLAQMGSGGTPPSSVASYYDGDIPWVSIADMTKGGKILNSTDRNISAEGFANSAAQMFPVGTILYAMYASLGECSIAGLSLCTSQAILGIKPNEKLVGEFLYYYLVSLKPIVKTLGQQGTQSNLNKGMVQGFKISLPVVAEQRAIVTILREMDAELSALEQRHRKTAALKQGMMQELLTGRTRLV